MFCDNQVLTVRALVENGTLGLLLGLHRFGFYLFVRRWSGLGHLGLLTSRDVVDHFLLFHKFEDVEVGEQFGWVLLYKRRDREMQERSCEFSQLVLANPEFLEKNCVR